MDRPALLAGASAVDITPPLTIPYLGSHPQRYGAFSGVHDPLMARAVALSHGEQHLAVLSVDAIGLSRDLLGPGRDFIAELRERACRGLPLRPDAVMAAATHAHSVPETYGILRLWEDSAFLDWADAWCSALANAIRLAWADRRPAGLRLGRARVDGLSINRRAALQTAGETHPVDDEVAVLRFCRGEAPDIILANAACHAVTVQVQPMVSADFPGVACRHVDTALGGARCVFLQGAAGDLNPRRGCTRDWADVADYGRRLGDAIIQAADDATPADPDDMPLAAAAVTVPVATRPLPDPAGLESEWQEVEDRLGGLPAADPSYAGLFQQRCRLAEARRLVAFGTAPIPVEIQAMRLGPAAIVGLPGEVFCADGMALRRRSPFAPTMVAELANGCVGYLVPRTAWASGGYEVGLGAWCRVASGEPERLMEAAAALVADLTPAGTAPTGQ